MIRKIDLGAGPHGHQGLFGNPAPMGLLGLAVACAALTPIAFGRGLDAPGFKTVAVFAFLFGGCLQLITGLMDFANKNSFGGTIFTTFAFNWFINAWVFWSMAHGEMPHHDVLLATEILLFVVFLVLTYGFGFFSSLLFYFLLDIDLLYLCKIIRGLSGTDLLNIPIAILTVLLGLIGLWIALAGLINPVARKEVFKIGGPMFFSLQPKRFDWSVRYHIFDILYHHWRTHAFSEMDWETLEGRIRRKVGERAILPDLLYLLEFGAVKISFEEGKPETPASVRLNAAGIDLYEQLILKKYEF